MCVGTTSTRIHWMLSWALFFFSLDTHYLLMLLCLNIFHPMFYRRFEFSVCLSRFRMRSLHDGNYDVARFIFSLTHAHPSVESVYTINLCKPNEWIELQKSHPIDSSQIYKESLIVPILFDLIWLCVHVRHKDWNTDKHFDLHLFLHCLEWDVYHEKYERKTLN